MQSTEAPEKSSEALLAMASLRHIVQALRRFSHAAESQLGISGAQLFVLRELAESPGSSLGDVARRTLTDASSVSVVVGRLVERGLVMRRPSDTDRRRAVLTLSAAGKALLRHAPEVPQSRLIAALEAVPARERKVFARTLDAVAQALGKSSEPGVMFFEGSAAPRSQRKGSHGGR